MWIFECNGAQLTPILENIARLAINLLKSEHSVEAARAMQNLA